MTDKANELYERARQLRAEILAYNQRAYELNSQEQVCPASCQWRAPSIPSAQPHEHCGWNLPLVRVSVVVEEMSSGDKR